MTHKFPVAAWQDAEGWYTATVLDGAEATVIDQTRMATAVKHQSNAQLAAGMPVIASIFSASEPRPRPRAAAGCAGAARASVRYDPSARPPQARRPHPANGRIRAGTDQGSGE